MITEPSGAVSAAARILVTAGSDLVAGYSAHVFHGVVSPRVRTGDGGATATDDETETETETETELTVDLRGGGDPGL